MITKTIKIGLIAGILILIGSVLYGIVGNILFPGIEKEYQNTSLFRPWSDPRMIAFFLHPFLLGVVLSFAWRKFHHVIHAETPTKKGVKFGMAYFFVAVIPGMFISYMSFQVSLLMVLSWTINGLIEGVLAGLTFVYLNDRYH
jgi:hypothetical protein